MNYFFQVSEIFIYYEMLFSLTFYLEENYLSVSM